MAIYYFLVKIAKSFIMILRKAASNLPLKDVIIFSSIPDFSDSVREVFDLMTTMEEFKGFRFVWFCEEPKKARKLIGRSAKVKKRTENPLLRLRHLVCESTAKYCVYSHEVIGNIYNPKQVRAHIEHGSFGIKKGVGSTKLYEYSTYRILTRETSLPNGRICGLPRNDRLFDPPEQTRRKLELDGYAKIIIWMPTFKHYKKRSILHVQRNDYGEETDSDITLQEDAGFFEEVNKTLNKHNMLLINKYHPSQDMRYVDAREFSNISVVTDEELLAADVRLYSFLGAADALVTDFSSVCYDYFLLDRPVGFDVTDLELYIQGGTCAVDDPLDYMPGEHIRSLQDFIRFLENVANGVDEYRGARNKLLDMIHFYKDDQSSKRVVDLILSSDQKKEPVNANSQKTPPHI